jgi:hypothetical protein
MKFKKNIESIHDWTEDSLNFVYRLYPNVIFI